VKHCDDDQGVCHSCHWCSDKACCPDRGLECDGWQAFAKRRKDAMRERLK
jgi:hypothetical protein